MILMNLSRDKMEDTKYFSMPNLKKKRKKRNKKNSNSNNKKEK